MSRRGLFRASRGVRARRRASGDASSTLTAMPYGRKRTFRVGSVLFLFARSASSSVAYTSSTWALPSLVDGVDGPHPVAGLAGRFRLMPLAARELVEEHAQPGPLTGHVEEFADRVAQSLAGLTDHSIEVVRVETERPIATHLPSVPPTARMATVWGG